MEKESRVEELAQLTVGTTSPEPIGLAGWQGVFAPEMSVFFKKSLQLIR